MLKRIITKLNQLHKRTGFLLLALACFSVVFALLLSMLAELRLNSVAKTGLVSISLGDSSKNIGLIGSGIDLNAIPQTNLLRDDSFEPYAFSRVFTVEEGTGNTIIISNKAAQPGIYGEGFYVGATLRVTANNENGITLRKTGKVTGYSPNQIGEFQKSPTLADIPSSAKLTDYTTKGNIVVAVGEKGTIIRGINTQSPAVVNSNVTSAINSVCQNESGFFACTADGKVLHSSDGNAWTAWKTPYTAVLNAVAASPDALVAVGNNGIVFTGSDGILYQKEIGTEENIRDITYGNGLFVAVTESGSILYSAGGILWERIHSGSAVSYRKIEYADGRFALLTGDGLVEIYSNPGTPPDSVSSFPAKAIDITIMSKTKILALTSDNQIYQSDNNGLDWTKSSITAVKNANIIGAVGDEEILCSSAAVNSYLARLVTEIRVDSELKEGTYQAGDQCYLSIEYPTLPDTYLDKTGSGTMESKWQFYGQGSAEKIMSAGAPFCGAGIMKLSAKFGAKVTVPYAAITQKISNSTLNGKLTPSTFYTFSIWLKQETLTEGTVKVWISGAFDSIGTEFTNIGTKWKKYTFNFLVPPGITGSQAAEARINIGTTTQGTYYLDEARINLASEKDETIPMGFVDKVKKISPTVTRLEFLGIGTASAMPDRWALDGKLEEALSLVSDLGTSSSPWIVADSHIGESELRNLMEYLAGTISSTYGKYRMENGSSLPWSTRFSRILIEFTDQDGHLQDDVSRAVFVNNAMDIIEASPYYKNIKNKIVFVDGMEYTEGILLSRADYSASELTCKISEDRVTSVDTALGEYISQLPRSADRPANLPVGFMKTTSFEKSELKPTTADLVRILLDPLGNQVNASLCTLTAWETAQWSEARVSAAMIASTAARGEVLTVKKTQVASEERPLSCYAYRYNNLTTLVFALQGSAPAAISANIPISFKDANYTRIDSNGKIVENFTLKKSDTQFNIMPGNVIMIQLA